jgi:hypothetical protein
MVSCKLVKRGKEEVIAHFRVRIAWQYHETPQIYRSWEPKIELLDYEPEVPAEHRSNWKCYGCDVKRLCYWMMHCVDTFFFSATFFYFVRTMAKWHPNRCVLADGTYEFLQTCSSHFVRCWIAGSCIVFDCIYSSGVELWVGVVEGHLESCVTNISKEYIKLDTEISSNLELFHTVSFP